MLLGGAGCVGGADDLVAWSRRAPPRARRLPSSAAAAAGGGGRDGAPRSRAPFVAGERCGKTSVCLGLLGHRPAGVPASRLA